MEDHVAMNTVETIQNDEQTVRNKITIITFFCSLLVIWIHTFNLDVYGIDEKATGFAKIVYYIENTWGSLTQIAVPFFFFVSGYLFFRTFSPNSIKEKYKSRIHSILIPYLIWCTVYYLYFIVLTNAPVVKNLMNAEQSTFSLIDLVKALWPNEYYTLWFLKEIIIFIAACPLIYVMYKNRYVGGLILLLLLVNAQFKFIDIPLEGCLYYSAGSYIALNIKGLEYFKSKLFTIIGIVFLVIMLALRFSILDTPIIRLMFFAAFWFAVDLLPLKKQYPWWMKITFFTYVGHDIFLEAYEKIILVVFGKGVLFALLDYILVPLMVFATLVVIAAFLRKFAPKVWKVCTGMR